MQHNGRSKIRNKTAYFNLKHNFQLHFPRAFRFYPAWQTSQHCLISINLYSIGIQLDKEKNQCIRQKTGAQNIVQEIKQYQEKWLQHVQRMDTNRLPKQALQCKGYFLYIKVCTYFWDVLHVMPSKHKAFWSCLYVCRTSQTGLYSQTVATLPRVSGVTVLVADCQNQCTQGLDCVVPLCIWNGRVLSYIETMQHTFKAHAVSWCNL